jgi:hypothetical protein
MPLDHGWIQGVNATHIPKEGGVLHPTRQNEPADSLSPLDERIANDPQVRVNLEEDPPS